MKNIKKMITTVMVVTGLALTSTANAWFFSEEKVEVSVQADYIWDNSKSHFMNTILEAGVDSSDYKNDWSKQEFVDNFGKDLYSEDFQNYVKDERSLLGTIWWTTTGGLDGFLVSQASGRPPWSTEMDGYIIIKLDKKNYPTKESFVKGMKDLTDWTNFENRYIQEYNSYWIFKRKYSLRDNNKKVYLDILSQEDSIIKLVVAENRFYEWAHQPHLVEGGKVHLPIKPE